MLKNNTVATDATLNLRIAVEAGKDRYNKRSLVGKLAVDTATTMISVTDLSHAGLSGFHAARCNMELKIAGNNPDAQAYIIRKYADIAKLSFVGLVWFSIKNPFVQNKRSKHIGAATKTMVDDIFDKDCISAWTGICSKQEARDMKILLKLLSHDGKSRKMVVETIEKDFDRNGYPDVASFYIQSMVDQADRVEMYKLEAIAAKENKKRKH